MKRLAYTIEEAAEALGLSHWTIRKYIHNGKIEVLRSNGQTGKILIAPSELGRLMRELREEGEKLTA